MTESKVNRLRVGVIGAGSVVREIYRHLYFHSAYSEMLSIEGVADPNTAVLDAFCDEYGIASDRRFADYAEMLEALELDAVQVNTPDCLHRAPAIAALEHDLDVMIPKPLADSIADAHAILATARALNRIVVVDFHKRDDPRVRDAAARYQRGEYGKFQTAVWYMLDKLLVADPNHQPRFFATADFAEKNTPISFLTVHMVDAFLQIIRQKPVQVRAKAYAQKLPSLTPIAVNGYDLCDTEVIFDSGGVAHVMTGWHLPNTAHAITVQSARIVCTEGLVDMALDASGLRDVTAEGISERNSLFRSFAPNGTVSGYGMDYPGSLYEAIIQHRAGAMGSPEYAERMGPLATGFYATVVCEAAHRSLESGTRSADGVVLGVDVDVAELLRERLGKAAGEYM